MGSPFSDHGKANGPVLYRAPFVVPVVLPLIEDGGVLIENGTIMAVDRFQRLRRQAVPVIELDDTILTPALINCHAHLELSHLAGMGQGDSSIHGDITLWIRELLVKRAEGVSPEESIHAGRAALSSLHRRGVALVADIGNQALSQTIGDGGLAESLFFHEMLGVTEQSAQTALANLTPDDLFTAHAPYSCHPSLLKALKTRARQTRKLFPIHVAESIAELEFLQTGSGPFQHFLRERLTQLGALADDQELDELVYSPGCGSVEYLHRLGLLDAQTICVHSVHISALEAERIAKARAKVCLCPGSNRRLGVGKADVSLLLERHILPGLGTDSLSSNRCLDLWYEMQVLQEDHPGLAPELIFSLATQGGAETLGVSHRLGSLSLGREAKMLAIAFRGQASDIYPFLVSSGDEIPLEWLEVGNGR